MIIESLVKQISSLLFYVKYFHYFDFMYFQISSQCHPRLHPHPLPLQLPHPQRRRPQRVKEGEEGQLIEGLSSRKFTRGRSWRRPSPMIGAHRWWEVSIYYATTSIMCCYKILFLKCYWFAIFKSFFHSTCVLTDALFFLIWKSLQKCGEWVIARKKRWNI